MFDCFVEARTELQRTGENPEVQFGDSFVLMPLAFSEGGSSARPHGDGATPDETLESDFFAFAPGKSGLMFVSYSSHAVAGVRSGCDEFEGMRKAESVV